ncbi:assimilatory nitrate reductase electron transfer subunit [Arthrobacter sp. CAN_A214]|uniref:FAD-dependent oxidoreductase n=1 Tax=Arthrobacter sp. CAN_A214 TaxID=2787720 RepID=UPI0018C9A6D4
MIDDQTAHRERILVLGFGPVAARLIEHLQPLVVEGSVRLTVTGAEPDGAYNRVLVADVAVGRTSADAIRLSDPDALRAAGIDVRLGTEARSIDRARRVVRYADGTVIPYDRLILVTGSQPVIPTLRGLNYDPMVPILPPGVTALRDLADAGQLAAAVRRGASVVVLGGGILGVEAAVALVEEGAAATLVHHGPHPLGRTIDDGGGHVLAAALRSAGVGLASDARAVGIELDAGSFAGLRLDDGTVVRGDALILSCGVRPRIALAEGAGLETASGILVDHTLRVRHDPHIWAIGDCAEVDCGLPACRACSGSTAPQGLIGPGWRQADNLGARFVADLTAGISGIEDPGPLAALEQAAVVMLKARGIDAVTAGDASASPWSTDENTQVALWADPGHGRYVKMVTRSGVLTGLVCVGMPRTAAELVLLFERGRELPADRSSLLRLDGAEEEGALRRSDPADTLCRCAGVARGTVSSALEGGCSTVDEVSADTRAGTGCGSCHSDIRALIEQHFAPTAPAA